MSTTLTFDPTTPKACAEVPITDDSDSESLKEMFFVNITSDDPAVELIPPAVPVTILDDDGKRSPCNSFKLVPQKLKSQKASKVVQEYG